ncbi:MAG: late competence development ComFB family protein [Cyanobacteriota bacterium]|nr:late competence development ComFB family protein [Cyanobacteriota bacterium]
MPVKQQSRKYHNIMEDLVAEEVRSQMSLLSPRLTQYIQRSEVETYALNRLPTLYASSHEGWVHQQKRARSEYLIKIKTAVRQALAAVQRDPLRSSTPLFEEPEEVVRTERPNRRKVNNSVEGEAPKGAPTHPYYWQQRSSSRFSQKVK